jgi:hypothetical protein
VLSLGALIIYRTGIQSSISSYYHTGMRDVFVGILFSIGIFLLSYKGHNLVDNVAGDLGCVFAVGVALFPTASDNTSSGNAHFIGYIHLAFAGLFFLTLIYFSLCLFTKTDPNRTPTNSKLLRNKVYKACGYIMSFCILLIFIYTVFLGKVASRLQALNPVFWLESIAVVAFGVSWLVKGEAILKDKVQTQENSL